MKKTLFKQVFKLLPTRLKIQFWWLLSGMLILAIIEAFAVGSIAFYAAAISDPDSTYDALIGNNLFHFFFSGYLLFESPKQMLGYLSLLVILSVIFKNIFSGFITLKIARFSAMAEAFFAGTLLEGFLNRDYIWHLNQNSADLIQKINWRHHIGRNFITPHLKVICASAILMTLLAALLIVQPVISMMFIIIQGGAGFVVYRLLRKGLDINARGCKELGISMNRHATRSLHGFKDVKISGKALFFVKSFKEHSLKFAKLFGYQQFWKESPLLALETLGFAMIASTIFFMLFILGYSPLETTGTTALLAVTAWRTLPAFNRVVSSMAGIRSSTPYVESLLEVIPKVNVGVQLQNNNSEQINFNETIEFKNVWFSYNGSHPVIQSFNKIIAKGTSLGIMGASGCGKSTLVDLLTGLLESQYGGIYIDGVRLTRNNVKSWQNHIGYVPQAPYIFDGTLAENVAFGCQLKEINENLVLSSCEMAAIDFLDQLPESIYSRIGERGVKLSGGQRQRVAIARALYFKPEVIVFDEATSALDELNDQQIRKLINGLKGKTTLVVVSHRKSTVEDCDEVINMI